MILAAGQTLDRPEFVISSSQNGWKPFFLPLDRPLRIVAFGEMRPQGGAGSTDPGGMVVPTPAGWTYPGTRDVSVDRNHRLFEPSLPYQALIGRVCGSAGCAPPFLVGRERTICAEPDYRDRLELWVNYIVSPPGMLERGTPLAMSAFSLQARSGGYRFVVTAQPESACQD